MAVQETDFVIVGAGIAGLRAAIGLAADGARVQVVTKEALGESNTNYAQGGIAVAMSGEEDVALHLDDTVNAGDGLVNRGAARVLVEEGPLRVDELLRWGTDFDREDGRLMLTREGAHSRNRILHAHGDATGAEIGRSLLRHARSIENITLQEWMTTFDLIVEDGAVAGVGLLDRDRGVSQVRARAVLLASGGAGQVYSDTTNPAVATGDGIAMAWRAGAEIADMEFYQFHPTALYLPGVQRFLLSEALRGEGAWLRNAAGERFMERYHPLLELAPRDVVARAITREGMGPAGETLPVYLDMRHVTKVDPATRFPGISKFLADYGLALRRDLIPVRPAAHYLMGGVRTDVHGRTSRQRLYAAGEAACTGVHGANRLASNSLLEGLVFGARAAEAMMAEAGAAASTAAPLSASSSARHPGREEVATLRTQLQRTMWEQAGLLRDAAGLTAALDELRAQSGAIPATADRPTIELRNLQTIGWLIVESALRREESRGAHYRNDFPKRADARFGRHSVMRQTGISFEDL
ncbi:MAG TPA: L-aspartate oxidase [Acidobacteriaceae bacterium]|jgi:L-aspartate oxidase|nr:L-aspartate oxidase [Acidobacteriaceae bacterium]